MGNRTSDICRICSASEKGLVRKNNEDAVLTLADDGVFAVMDGMGGGDAGEIASGIVKKRLAETMTNSMNDSPGDRKYQFQQCLHKANADIIEYTEKKNLQSMGTTIVAFLLNPWDPSLADVCHIGDSRCYCLRDGELFRLTEDHVLADLQKKNVLTNSLGGCSFMAADWNQVSVCPGDRFLLCSDGLSSVVPEESLRVIWSENADTEKTVRRLEEAVLKAGAPDNYSIICIDMADDLPGKAAVSEEDRKESEYLYSIAERRKDYGRQ